MTEQLTTRAVFAKRAEQWNDKAPVFAAMCRAVADEPELAACVDDGPVAGRPKHSPAWSRPHQLAGLVSRLLRTKASGHGLTEYWGTLGGRLAPDGSLADVLRDLARRYQSELAELAAVHTSSRGNDPLVAVVLWPGIAWAASQVSGPVALLELGSAAGTCLYPDRYGYRFGDRLIGGDRPLVLPIDWNGEKPDFLSASVDVAARIGLEYEPVRREDDDAVAWLRDCVLPDNADELARVDGALSVMEPGGVDWRVGDYMETLPKALSEVPDGVTPIVFGAHTLCCAEERERLPRILAESGRDLVWVAKECSDHGLALVSDAASEYEVPEGTPKRVLLTAVRYRAGRALDGWALGEPDQWNASLDWAPHQVPLR